MAHKYLTGNLIEASQKNTTYVHDGKNSLCTVDVTARSNLYTTLLLYKVCLCVDLPSCTPHDIRQHTGWPYRGRSVAVESTVSEYCPSQGHCSSALRKKKKGGEFQNRRCSKAKKVWSFEFGITGMMV